MHNLTQTWQAELAHAITEVQELCQILALDPQVISQLIDPDSPFPLRAPRSFVARMEKGNIQDPLLQQILPLNQELLESSGFCKDPLQEKAANPVPGLLHKYHGRVLLIAAKGCAIHCRYCFRRHFPYEENTPGIAGWQPTLDYITADSSINEVILSGGDPLILKDHYLSHLINQLAEIPHVQTLRIHTRVPIVLPSRITLELIELLTTSRLQPVVVVHSNHPNEIDEPVKKSLLALHHAGVTLLNQFVLLKDINNDAEVLISLCQKLFKAGVLPYYLHLLDPVQGAQHFAVTAEQGQDLIRHMHARLPGYLVPKLVCEIPSANGKTLIS